MAARPSTCWEHQTETPGGRSDAQRANWLPAPDDRFFLFLRAYLPRPEMLDGRYRLPDPQRLSNGM